MERRPRNWIAGGLVLTVLIVGVLWMGAMEGHAAPAMMGYPMLMGVGWLGLGLMTLFWIGLIGLLIWGMSTRAAAVPSPPEEGPLEILRRRYAHGEISQAEFRQARDALR